ncbi:MAG: di-trans,poly-cis-decaprenylcistransferase [Nitriliruptorales bacterium]|nr:di-trans,poly-cis-decaprenylcistransferase [Nitriliruptorales bacterium]
MLTTAVYRLYERRLEAGLRGCALPAHVGVILDGNRRYARARGLGTVADGHRLGAEKIHELLDWCHGLGIPYVSLWMLSTENLSRDERELGDLIEIIAETIDRIAHDPRNHERGVRITAVGALDVLPDELRRALKDAEDVTAGGDTLHVQVAVGYGGRREIIDALRGHLEEQHALGRSLQDVIADLSPEAIAGHLYTSGTPDPDLIIRTSGEIRLSGFLLWQSVHSEFYFCDALWPAFRRTDFLRALRAFASRQRRFGR